MSSWIKKEVIGNHVLYLGDCLEIMLELEPVDAVVTDPPFNVGKDFKNDALTKKEWKIFTKNVAEAIKHLKPVNVLVEVGKNDAEMHIALSSLLNYKWALVLNYTNSMRQGAVGYANFGLVYWYGGKCYHRYKDRLDSALNSTKKAFKHPAPKELSHYRQLCSMFTTKQQIVLDPFMGSGTTGVACEHLKRKFIGIEIEPKYFDIACKRILAAVKNPTFKFADKKPKPKLKSIFGE